MKVLFSDVTPREELTVNEVAADILSRCLDFHHQVWPEKFDEHAKFEKVYIDHLMEVEVSGDRALQDIQEQAKSGSIEEVSTQGALFVITQSYAIEAIQAYAEGNELLAKGLLLDACYWCGNMWGSIGAGKAIRESVKRGRSAIPRAGGIGRSLNDKPLKEEVYRYVRENGPWKTRSYAARVISSESCLTESKVPLLAKRTSTKKYREHGFPHSTLYGWLREMPDAKGLFNEDDK
ncbi:hypothetical protein [Chromobacterium subtsugae]|uniref:hypothetical protein n=1 Tax=Chromobacterium subtsugae TaxID=251747 RepID=UPI000AAAE103|nr:hypothetical protein [Chromobacterium subtsugae]